MSMHEGLPVAGYRPQSTTAIDQVNRNKLIEETILRQIDALKSSNEADPRMLAIARTQMEGAFMWLNRAIFQPSRVDIPDEMPARE